MVNFQYNLYIFWDPSLNCVISKQKRIDYIEMVIFQYNPYIFGIHLWTVLYPKLCYNESCYKEVLV